jgi:flagellar protein FlgJ
MSDAVRGVAEAPAGRSVAEPSNGRAAELRKASHALEGVFVNELFKAMRATVPQGGFLSEDPGHDLFTGMLDERLAQSYAERAQGGLGEALYRQLSRRLRDAGPDQGAS